MSRPQRVVIETLVVLAVCAVIAVILTWPLAANFDTIIAGGGSAGDNTGYLWDLWSNSHYGLDLWGGGLQSHIGVPFGRTVIGGANLLLFFYTGPGWVLASLFPTIVAYNIITLTGLTLAGASMYLLIRWLGLGMGAAAWAGLAFEIFPYELQRTAAFPPLGLIQFAPLLIMASIFWLQRPSWRRAALLAAATLYAWLSNPYFGAMALVAAAVTLIVGLVLTIRRSDILTAARRMGEAVAALIVIVGVPLALIIGSTRGVAEGIVTRQRIELELYGAHVGDYLKPLPGEYLMSGIFGTADHWPVVSEGGERIAFLGWSVLALAAVGLVLAWRQRSTLTQRERVGVILAIPLALAMGIFSLASPTRIFGHPVPMPSSLVFDYLPFLRVYARFSLFVMAAVLVIAGLGLSLLIRNRSVTWRASVVATALIITAMELPLSLPIGTGVPFTVDGHGPEDVPSWQWLAHHDRSAVAIETPAFPNEVLDRQFLYGQLVHGHPLANGGLNEPGAATDFGREYGNPSLPSAPAAYATAGIKYVVLNPWAWQQAGLTMPDVAAPPPGYAVAAAFPGGGGIWRVTAPPRPAIAIPGDGWDAVAINGIPVRYMGPSATYIAWAPKATTTIFRFRTRAVAPGSRYTVHIVAPDGSATTLRVSTWQDVAIQAVLPKGRSTFRLDASGSPVHAVGPDFPQGVTVQMTEWKAS